MENEDKDALLDLLLAVNVYVKAKSQKGFKFVKKLGVDADLEGQEAEKILFTAFENAEYLLPEAEERLKELNAEVMKEIEAEEEDFDNT